MPAKQTTLLEEMIAAAQGVVAVLMGNRQAPRFFDFSQRGLIGSFVAFLSAMLVNGLSAMLLTTDSGGMFTRGTLLIGILYAIQLGIVAVILRQLGRPDALVPYLVATNWASFFTAVATVLFAALGDLVTLVTLVVGIVLQINIARLIMTLPGRQVAIFLIAQYVALTVAFVLVIVMFPALMPGLTEAMAEASAAAQDGASQ